MFLAARQKGRLIMIAAGISRCNYQHWLIHSLIASFNLFTFGAEQCQPATVESDLLQGHVTFAATGLMTAGAGHRFPIKPCFILIIL